MTPRSSVAICEKCALLKMASIKAVRALSCWNLWSAATVIGVFPRKPSVKGLVMSATTGTRCWLSELVCWFAVMGSRARPEPVLSGGVSATSGLTPTTAHAPHAGIRSRLSVGLVNLARSAEVDACSVRQPIWCVSPWLTHPGSATTPGTGVRLMISAYIDLTHVFLRAGAACRRQPLLHLAAPPAEKPARAPTDRAPGWCTLTQGCRPLSLSRGGRHRGRPRSWLRPRASL